MPQNAPQQQQKESLGELEHLVHIGPPFGDKSTAGGTTVDETTTTETSEPPVTSSQQRLDPDAQSGTSLVHSRAQLSKSITTEDGAYRGDDGNIKGTDRGDTSKQNKGDAHEDQEESPPWLSPTGARAVHPWKALMRVPWPAGIQPEFRTVFCHRWGYRCGSCFDGLAVDSGCGEGEEAQLAVDPVGIPVGRGVPATRGPDAPGSLLETITRIIPGDYPLRMQLPRCEVGLTFSFGLSDIAWVLTMFVYMCSLYPFLFAGQVRSLEEPIILPPGARLAVHFRAALPRSFGRFSRSLLLCHLVSCSRMTGAGEAFRIVFKHTTRDRRSIGAPGRPAGLNDVLAREI